MRIKQLSPLIANQIAAGEVVERPASVVKELLENSLDAGADAIAIDISYGGLNQIKISDNGVGIVADDLPLAIAAHATSKIKTLDDLYAIHSMGFRGEALASIASVAKVTISSKPSQQDTAMMLRVQGTEVTLTPCARTVGTTVEVVDLFYNAPVRKRFLKSEKLESQLVETVVKRFALSAPRIAITLKHNGKLVLSLPAVLSDQARITRMTRIFGSAFVSDAIYLDVEHSAMKLSGWISGVNFQRSQNDRMWVYINQRMVKDKLIHHALKHVYEGILYPGRFPACVLYFTINPVEVDVNVHPTKHEVRFQQPRLIFDFFTSQLTAALNSGQNRNIKTDYAVLKPKRDAAEEIYEPYPQLTKPEGNIHPIENDLTWVILNNRYIITFIQQQPYIVDIVGLQHARVQEHLSHLVFPLPSRPLLVPIRYTLFQNINLIAELIHYCNLLGIHIQETGDQEVLIRSIPLCVPYLDLRLFLDTVTGLEVLNPNNLIELMSQSQVFDSRLFTPEEKKELNALLLRLYREKKPKEGLFKSLAIEDCRNLLHV